MTLKNGYSKAEEEYDLRQSKESYTQEELRQISEAFKIVFNKTLDYPSDYQDYLIAWQNKDKSFSYGTYEEGNKQVKIQGRALWNFPIRKLR